jgi:hypothetical protein
MRWKSVAFAGVISPAVAGCNLAHLTARNLVNEPHVVWTQHAIEHDLRRQARAAFQEVCGEYPDRAFSDPFRDGFTDGYVDYLDRGGNASMPAVPPSRYTRHPRYYTEEGQCLVKEYFLGFKYGQEVAIATGRRQYLTVPVLLPQPPVVPPVFNVQPAPGTAPMMPPPRPPGGSDAPPIGGAIPPPAPTPPKPAGPAPGVLPTPRSLPRPAPRPPATKPDPLPVPPADPDRLPAPAVPLPVAGAGADLPAIPVIPTPPAPADEAPVLPPNHVLPPPLPPNHPRPRN